MQYRSFGKLGWQVSSIGVGTWALGSNWGPQDDQESVAALNKALDLGSNFIDTARAYGNGRSERIVAQALKSRQRDKVYVASKIPPQLPGDWPPGPYDSIEDRFPAKHVQAELEASLRDLQTDCIDLMQVHTWSRAWNSNPSVFELMARFRQQGKIRAVGVSTPEHDQYAVLDLMRDGLVDSVQVIYNIFDQDAAMQMFPLAEQLGIAIIVRVPFDESSLTGKLTLATQFPEGDIRGNYFAGDRLARTVARVDSLQHLIGTRAPNMAHAALQFALQPTAVSTVIPGIRSVRQAELNCAVSDQPPMSADLAADLRQRYWRRPFWYAGK
ncbi:MAG: aldo/keto reductase [Planctomycetota bacterium]|nr:aldo/keto reductase [Planctomycetota bacterium]